MVKNILYFLLTFKGWSRFKKFASWSSRWFGN